jgi:galactosamine-6-phosphate isomerase
MAYALHIEPTHEGMSRCAADLILWEIRRNLSFLLCVATGSTPALAYDLVAQAAPSCPELRLLKLDEWGGLAMDDPATCEVYLRKRLVTPLGISEDRYIAWNTRPYDPQAECARIARFLGEHGPVDLCVLGLGANGHLGFNEPADVLRPGPHVARLSSASLEHPMLDEAQGQASFGLTLGMADILQSRRTLLLVSGRHKAAQLRRLIEGGITTQFPASFLHLHSNLTILCDADAASQLHSRPSHEV